MDLQIMGRILGLVGLSMVVLGGVLWLSGRIGLGTLPGDVRFNGASWGRYMPIVSSILVSLLLTIVLNLIRRCGQTASVGWESSAVRNQREQAR